MRFALDAPEPGSGERALDIHAEQGRAGHLDGHAGAEVHLEAEARLVVDERVEAEMTLDLHCAQIHLHSQLGAELDRGRRDREVAGDRDLDDAGDLEANADAAQIAGHAGGQIVEARMEAADGDQERWLVAVVDQEQQRTGELQDRDQA